MLESITVISMCLKKDKFMSFVARATVFFAGGFTGLVLVALAMLAVLALLGLL